MKPILLSTTILACCCLSGCAQHTIPVSERAEITAQVDAVGRIMDARCDEKISEKQCVYLLNKESEWERGEITREDYERAERKIIPTFWISKLDQREFPDAPGWVTLQNGCETIGPLRRTEAERYVAAQKK
jgi:hypothetical protein